MRTFGHVILGVLATLMVLGGLVLIIFGAVLLSWANDPGFGGVFTTGGLISLPLGLGLVLAGAFLFRRLDAGAPHFRGWRRDCCRRTAERNKPTLRRLHAAGQAG
jgi:hypothetical protein